MCMRRAIQVLPTAPSPVASITLAAAERHRRRVMLTDDAGQAFLLDLPRAVHLRHGEGLLLEDGGVIAVVAADEDVVEVPACPRLAWHIGNRHIPVQVLGDTLRLPAEPVLLDLLARQGVTPIRRRARFEPEPGAYEAHGLFESVPVVRRA